MKTIYLKDLSVGDVIEYAAFGGEKRIVRIEHLEEDVKNGLPGFDGVQIDMPIGDDWKVWGYCDQILRIIRKA